MLLWKTSESLRQARGLYSRSVSRCPEYFYSPLDGMHWSLSQSYPPELNSAVLIYTLVSLCFRKTKSADQWTLTLLYENPEDNAINFV